ncbi:hypothetical protein P879_05114 [Paragonimus westermani]|uniref:Innexin n=1 Tax=Paragonimus westermani TaxID=34504 RepID=A0A8T0DTK9_9TREM|nr:hypothetical protein P879_05114 [Paragonimus westermani]
MDAAFIWNLSKLGRIGSRRLQFDDDFADRLNYQYTSVLLFLFIGLIGVRQYVGKPIQCWIPQEFTRGWEEYAENYCWVANTYFAPIQDRLPPVPDRRELLLVYYQWAPIVMAAQALLFYLPCLTWRLCMAHSGFNLHRILQMAADANEMMPDTASKTVAILAHYIRSCIQRQRVCSRQTARFGAYACLNTEERPSTGGGVSTPSHKRPNDHSKEEQLGSNRLGTQTAGTDSQHVPATAQLVSLTRQPTNPADLNEQNISSCTMILEPSSHSSQTGQHYEPVVPPADMSFPHDVSKITALAAICVYLWYGLFGFDVLDSTR